MAAGGDRPRQRVESECLGVAWRRSGRRRSAAGARPERGQLGCLDLPACASMAAASGHLALKWWMAVSAGDLDLAQTARAGLAAAAPVAATMATTVATTGTYDLNSLERATATLPAMPAQRSTAGRPTNPRLAPVFHGGSSRAASASSVARPRGRGRAAKPPPSGSGKPVYHCDRCNGDFASDINRYHYKLYTISRPGEPSLKRRLCIIKDKKQIATLKKQVAVAAARPRRCVRWRAGEACQACVCSATGEACRPGCYGQRNRVF